MNKFIFTTLLVSSCASQVKVIQPSQPTQISITQIEVFENKDVVIIPVPVTTSNPFIESERVLDSHVNENQLFLNVTDRIIQVVDNHECSSKNIKGLIKEYNSIRPSILSKCQSSIRECSVLKSNCDNSKCLLDSEHDFLGILSKIDKGIIDFDNTCTSDLVEHVYNTIDMKFVSESIRASIIPKSDFTTTIQSVVVCNQDDVQNTQSSIVKVFVDLDVLCTGVECEGTKYQMYISIDENGNYNVEKDISGTCKLGAQ